jgi:4-hydroxybenzoate polyprenyltransferase
MSVVLKEEMKKVTAIAGFGMGLILLVPFIDAITGGYLVTYPLRLEPYLVNFLNPFVSMSDIGVSPGQRIVVFLISCLIGIYGYIKTEKIITSIFLGLACFGVIVIWGGLTTFLAGNRPETIYVSGGILYTDSQKFAAIYMLLFIPILFLYCFLFGKHNFKLAISSTRFYRIVFFGGMGIFGFILGIHQKGIFFRGGVLDFAGILLIFLCPAFGFSAAQVLNDFIDIEGDRITKPRNPLIRGIERKYYVVWGVCLTTLCLAISSMINFSAFLIMIAFLMLSVIYSAPPVRLKRIPVISTFMLSVSVILILALGFSVFYGNRALNELPLAIIIPTLVSITLGFSTKDIKDLKGDKADGVLTLPGLLYEDNLLGRLPMALIVGSSYLYYIIFIPTIAFGAVLCSCLTIIYTIFVQKKKELFYFIMLYAFGLYLLYTIVQLPPLR